MLLKFLRESLKNFDKYKTVYIIYTGFLFIEMICENIIFKDSNNLGMVSLITKFSLWPAIYAIIFGALKNHIIQKNSFSFQTIGTSLKNYFSPFLGVTFFLFVIFIIGLGSLSRLGLLPENDNAYSPWINQIVYFPLRAIGLFWYAAIVVDNGHWWRSLGRSCKMIFTDIHGSSLGLIWGLLFLYNLSVTNYIESNISTLNKISILAIHTLVFSFFIIIGCSLVLRFYIHLKEKRFRESVSKVKEESEQILSSNCNKSTEKSKLLPFVFLFPISLIVMLKGYRDIKQKKFMLRPLISFWLGLFFTGVWLIGILGSFLPKATGLDEVDYSFITQYHPKLGNQVVQLTDKKYEPVILFYKDSLNEDYVMQWGDYAILGFAKQNNYDLEGAIQDFKSGAALNPPVGEYYYYFANAYLRDGNLDKSYEMNKKALELNPNLIAAQQSLELNQNFFEPDRITTTLWFIVILMFLFTIHEFAHAYTAMKLGDDTAFLQGRVSLNPIKHIDIFGSIILPGILLFKNAGIVFGWAKPVPVDRSKLKNPKEDDVFISFAGPGMNLVVTMLSCLLIMVVLVILRIVQSDIVAYGIEVPGAGVSFQGIKHAKEIAMFMVLC